MKTLPPPKKTAKKKTTSLRKKAEGMLAKQKARLRELSATDLKKLVHELGTHQIELEMQNEELRRAQAEIDSSRRKYADLYDFSPVGYFTFDKNGLILEVNHTGAAMLGRQKRFLIAKPIQNFIEPDNRAAFRVHLTDVLTTETVQTCEINLRGKDGVLVSAQLQSISADSGEGTASCRTAVSDISRRKHAEEQLQQNKIRFEAIFENSIDAIGVSKDGMHVMMNPAYISLYGYASSVELVHKPIIDLIAPLEREKVLAYVRSREAGEAAPSAYETRGLRKDGAEFVMDVHVTTYTLSGETYTLVIIRDITKRKRAEETLRQSEERFRTLTENSPECIALHDLDLRHLYVNPAITRVLGLPQEAFVGKTVWEVGMPQEAAAKLDSLLRPALVTGRENIGELMFPSSDGPHFYTWRSVPIFNNDGSVGSVLALASDITERKRAEEALKQTNAELTAVNRELEAYSYAVSHDLRAPLRAIEGFTTAIIEDYGATLNEDVKNYFNRVVSASKRMSQLIDAMLKMARLTKGEMREKTIDLSGLAEIASHELRKRDPGRAVDFVIAKGLKAQGDREMLNTVIENLLDNAWKFTSRHPAAKIEFGATGSNGKTIYFVRDDGAGFDMQYVDKHFHPFKRLHSESEFPGLGIGLAIAYRIINRHGGTMWAESAPEKGATFYFTL